MTVAKHGTYLSRRQSFFCGKGGACHKLLRTISFFQCAWGVAQHRCRSSVLRKNILVTKGECLSALSAARQWRNGWVFR